MPVPTPRRVHPPPVIAVVLAALLPAATSAQEPDPGHESPYFRFVEAGEGVWAAVTLDHLHPSSYANAVVVAGTDGILVVDAHHGPDSGGWLAEQIRRVSDLPVRWLVQTHWHGDHVWGSSALREAFPGVVILGHPATRDSLASGGERQREAEVGRLSGLVSRVSDALEGGAVPEAEVERYREALARYRMQLAEAERSDVILPERMVEAALSLELGARTVSVLHPGPGHTRGDLAVWVPDAGLLVAGDLVEDGALWLDGADVRGWAAALGRLRELRPRQVVASHGRLRPDAALLEAHGEVLAAAVQAMSGLSARDSAAFVRTMEPQRTALERWGVAGTELDAYLESLRRSLLASPPGSVRPGPVPLPEGAVSQGLVEEVENEDHHRKRNPDGGSHRQDHGAQGRDSQVREPDLGTDPEERHH